MSTLSSAVGIALSGRITGKSDEWLQLLMPQGAVSVQLAHVAVIAEPGVADGLSAQLPQAGKAFEDATPAPQPAKKSRSQNPGRPWQDDELRMLADAFLDGITDKELAKEFGRTPAVVKQLRQGFECARGNLVEDQISEVAVTWVHRWRRVLSPE